MTTIDAHLTTLLDPMTVPVTLRRELLAVGWTDKLIRSQLRRGDLTTVRHGAYLDTPTWEAIDDVGRHLVRTRCTVGSAAAPVVVSHTSAALLWGAPTWGLDLSDVHLTRTDGRIGRHEAGVHQHAGKVDPDDVRDHRGVRTMSPTRVALETSTILPLEASVVLTSHLLHAGLTTAAELEERYQRPGSSLELWPGSNATPVVLRLSDSRFESVGEARFFTLCFRYSLPMPIPQYEIVDDSGRLVARVDFAWPQLRRFGEFDGREKYLKHLRKDESPGDAVFREKRREDRVRELTGWQCIRPVWADLERPQPTADRVRRFLEGGPA